MQSKQEHKDIPKEKRQELEKITHIISSIKDTDVSVEMVLLFGSYARGDFVVRDVVSEGWGTRVYESDFDILVITRRPGKEKHARFSISVNSIIEKDSDIRTRVSIIVEDIFHVNKMLEEGRYFYVDIKQEGIILYDNKNYRLKNPKTLSEKKRKTIQQEDYDMWFNDGLVFFWHYGFDVQNKDYKIAAFSLHQATEKFITAYLLVKTGYKPKTHDLEVLYNNIIEQDTLFWEVFYLKDLEENRHFELLRKAYIEARYSKVYTISLPELLFLEKKVLILKELIFDLCQKELS